MDHQDPAGAGSRPVIQARPRSRGTIAGRPESVFR